MKLLVLNLNTSDEMTALIERTARQVASPGTVLRCLTARFGARYIATRATVAVAAHAASIWSQSMSAATTCRHTTRS